LSRAERFSPAQYARQVRSIRASGATNATILVVAPFVIVSDQPEAQARETADASVLWAVKRLKQDFFSRDPDQIVTLWLYANQRGYESAIRERFPNAPPTPFGFYAPEYQAVVVNVSTGGGTLVHEIVHPFVAANVADCPPWLNEGLGSLFEQSEERDGHIAGATNWRLQGLQQAIEGKSTVALAKLMSASRAEFQHDNPVLYYAQARYLLYFLQERGLLRNYWEDYSKNRGSDPTGEKTILRVAKAKDLPTFQRTWESAVMTYRFDP
jgi:hypothetical protein